MSSLAQPENSCKAVRSTHRGWQGTRVQISASLLLATLQSTAGWQLLGASGLL